MRMLSLKENNLEKYNLLRVITYHRVAEPSKTPLLNPRIISATPKDFAKQIKTLANNYNVISMERVLECVHDGNPLPKGSVLITFDDAYIDFKEVAWPILKHYNLPVTLFVPTGYPDQPYRSFWWDKIYAAFIQTPEQKIQIPVLGDLILSNHKKRLSSLYRLQQYVKTLSHDHSVELIDQVCTKLGYNQSAQPSVLTWEQLQELAKEGVTLGAHTRTHPILTQISPDQVRQEIEGSYQDLKREIGKVLPIFAYPNGNHNDKIIDILKEEGIKIAFTTLDGFNDMSTADPHRLNRINITRNTSPLVFRLRLLKWFSHIDKWRHQRKSNY